MTQVFPNASFIRRLAAMVYDFLLIIAIWLFSGSMLVGLIGQATPTDGHLPDQAAIPAIWMQTICYIEVFLFYIYFWCVRGQSLGMQVWKIKVVNPAGSILTYEQAIIRFFMATISIVPFGLGFFWMLMDKDRLTLHDRMANSRVIYLGDKPYESEKIT